jgi:hypothetical protein
MQLIVTQVPASLNSVVGDRHEYREGDDMILTRYDAPVPSVGVPGLARDSGDEDRRRSLWTLVVILVFVSGMLVGSRTNPVGLAAERHVHPIR